MVCEAADWKQASGGDAAFWHGFGLRVFGGLCDGYGRYAVSLSGDSPPVLFARHEAVGIAHFQQSGAGRIRMYYNYLLTTPLGADGLAGRMDRQGLIEERAWPGFYAGKFEELGIGFEVVAAERGVRHRYDFPEGLEPSVAVDVSAGGLLMALLNGQPIRRSWLKMEEFLQGGSLHVKMGNEPSDFGFNERPPSFSS